MVFAIILIVFGLLLVMLGTAGLIWVTVNTEYSAFGPLLCLVVGWLVLGFSLKEWEKIDAKVPPKTYEYPAKEYVLEYKMIEYQSQKDTVYVLTERKPETE